jgi:hypothetical protein
VACPQTAHSRRKGHLKKKRKVGRLFLLGLFKGGSEKKNDESDVHLPQRQKKVVTYSILFLFLFLFDFLKAFFGRFVTRGVQKRD